MEYTAKDIKQLPFPESVRKRPGIYMGSNDKNGALLCLREIINNSVDEHLRGFNKKIIIERISDSEFKVHDEGRGIPFDQHESGKNALEVVLGELHSGRNFDEKDRIDSNIIYSTGLNGVGAAVVNASSEFFKVSSYRKDNQASIEFNKGVVSIKPVISKNKTSRHGTSIHFKLDSEVLEEFTDIEDILKLVQETAYLNDGLIIHYKDTENEIDEELTSSNGVLELCNDKLADNKPLIKTVSYSETINNVKISVSFNYTNTYDDEDISSFVNTIRTSDGGTHVTGFKRALSGTLNKYIKDNKLIKETLDSEDFKEGLVAVISVFVATPKYASQAKTKLDNNEVNGYVFQATNNGLKKWLDSSKDIKLLAKKLELSAKGRIAKKKALDNVRKSESSSIISSLNSIKKFTNCIEDDSSVRELYIVEGSSAAGTVNEARDKFIQAVYGLKGKPLNVYGMPNSKVYDNDEMSDLLSILGCGEGANFNYSKLKYNKIIFLADSDTDGLHIVLLLTTLFHEQWKELISSGNVYIAKAPLYRILDKQGKALYLKDDVELNRFYIESISNLITYNMGGKTITKDSNKETIIRKLKEYSMLANDISKKYQVSKDLIELVFLRNFEGYDLDISGDEFLHIETDIKNDLFSISGFHVVDGIESFISINNIDYNKFILDLSNLYDYYKFFIEKDISLTLKDKAISKYYVDSFDIIEKIIENKVTITRFKGLGEANADDLKDSVMNVKTRDLIQLKLDENSNEIITNFMDSKNPDFRKKFLLDGFKIVLE